MGAVVVDQRCEEDATEVGGGVFVVAGGGATPLFEWVESALDGVALAVDGRLEP